MTAPTMQRVGLDSDDAALTAHIEAAVKLVAAAVNAYPLAVSSELADAMPHTAQQIVFQEKVDAIADAAQRLHRLNEQLAAIVPTWSITLPDGPQDTIKQCPITATLSEEKGLKSYC